MSNLESGAPNAGSVDIFTRPRVQRVSSVIELAVSILCFAYSGKAPGPWPFVLGSMLFWDAIRVLGWKLEVTPEYLRIRRYFLWRSIPWAQICAVAMGDTWGRGQKAVRLSLASQPSMSLGAFGEPFALAVSDGLRAEIKHRRGANS